MNAYQIMTTFWDAVSILEMTCKLPVICAVSDGAKWLQNVFLKYLADWKLSPETGGEEGDFSVKER